MFLNLEESFKSVSTDFKYESLSKNLMKKFYEKTF